MNVLSLVWYRMVWNGKRLAFCLPGVKARWLSWVTLPHQTQVRYCSIFTSSPVIQGKVCSFQVALLCEAPAVFKKNKLSQVGANQQGICIMCFSKCRTEVMEPADWKGSSSVLREGSQIALAFDRCCCSTTVQELSLKHLDLAVFQAVQLKKINTA